jgi:hypothetical protein
MAGSAAQGFCAFSAASTAEFTSATVPLGNWEMISSVAGLTTSRVFAEATNSPPISIS